MYRICKLIEDIFKYIRIRLKIFYWKLKYGKRIKIGKRLNFRKGLSINISNNGYLEIGDNCFFNNYCSINCHKKIIIGDNNIFGENVKLYDHNHVFNDKSVDVRHSYTVNDIQIGNENWIASNVTILSKCKLLNNNVIGANVVLNKAYDSDNILKNNDASMLIEKIKYKE